ncbi:hypothetical protein [Hyphomicrobium sp. ghe19]|uniref:hypothetical protein n=1 Tax=Hyphomicrobium sp. ghe19 TaxID=2682968 RepID=UPI0013669AD5|nr:hypothetical protein HYPP_02666 [Hyphomicrobium sp. ghe19]
MLHICEIMTAVNYGAKVVAQGYLTSALFSGSADVSSPFYMTLEKLPEFRFRSPA